MHLPVVLQQRNSDLQYGTTVSLAVRNIKQSSELLVSIRSINLQFLPLGLTICLRSVLLPTILAGD